MDECEGHYAKWNKSEKDKYYMISLMYSILKKKKAKLIETENRMVVAKGWGWENEAKLVKK